MTQSNPLRLAFRVEGEFWNVYVALRDTMEDATLLGSLRISVLESSAGLKADFMRVMQAALAVAVREAIGAKVSWPEPAEPAPEHERSGRA